jgi:hypothetical protein
MSPEIEKIRSKLKKASLILAKMKFSIRELENTLVVAEDLSILINTDDLRKHLQETLFALKEKRIRIENYVNDQALELVNHICPLSLKELEHFSHLSSKEIKSNSMIISDVEGNLVMIDLEEGTAEIMKDF